MDRIIYWLFGGMMVEPFPVISTAFIHTMEDMTMTKFRNTEKVSKKEIRESLMSLAADQTPNRFNVRFDSDGSGACVLLMVERDKGEDSNGKSPFENWEHLPAKHLGWRVVFVHVPHKYIDVFYNADGTYKVTADS